MPSEAGDLKIIGNFRKLIDQVSADANYNPAARPDFNRAGNSLKIPRGS